jgi:lipoyl(octanoyl) transferase
MSWRKSQKVQSPKMTSSTSFSTKTKKTHNDHGDLFLHNGDLRISSSCLLSKSLMQIASRVRFILTVRAVRGRLLFSSAATTTLAESTPSTSTRHTGDYSLSLTTSTTTSTVKIHSSLTGGECMDYAKSWAWQQTLLNRRLEARREGEDCANDDCVLVLEHTPVYTLGRGANENNLTFLKEETEYNQIVRAKLSRTARGPGSARLAIDRRHTQKQNVPLEQAVEVLSKSASPVLAPNGAPIFRVERGGEVTFHGPSQLVVYPLLDLRRPPFQQDLHWYLRMVEEVIIKTLAEYQIDSGRDQDNTGVWVGDYKVAAVGVAASKWITTHGFALNVSPDLSFFDASLMLPCGIEGKGVTSIAQVLKECHGNDVAIPSLQNVADVVVKKMQDVFGVEFEHGHSLS